MVRPDPTRFFFPTTGPGLVYQTKSRSALGLGLGKTHLTLLEYSNFFTFNTPVILYNYTGSVQGQCGTCLVQVY